MHKEVIKHPRDLPYRSFTIADKRDFDFWKIVVKCYCSGERLQGKCNNLFIQVLDIPI